MHFLIHTYCFLEIGVSNLEGPFIYGDLKLDYIYLSFLEGMLETSLFNSTGLTRKTNLKVLGVRLNWKAGQKAEMKGKIKRPTCKGCLRPSTCTASGQCATLKIDAPTTMQHWRPPVLCNPTLPTPTENWGLLLLHARCTVKKSWLPGARTLNWMMLFGILSNFCRKNKNSEWALILIKIKWYGFFY